jgi:hypothetical protein
MWDVHFVEHKYRGDEFIILSVRFYCYIDGHSTIIYDAEKDLFKIKNQYFSYYQLKDVISFYNCNNYWYPQIKNYLPFIFKRQLFDKSELKLKINFREFKNTDLGKILNNDVLQLIFSFIW